MCGLSRHCYHAGHRVASADNWRGSSGKRYEKRRQRAPRAPSLRYLVKLAVKCDSAEQLGKKSAGATSGSIVLQGIAPSDRSRVEGELARELADGRIELRWRR